MARTKKGKLQHDNKIKLIDCFNARRHLYLNGFITENENDKIMERLLKFQDKHRIEVTSKELNGF